MYRNCDRLVHLRAFHDARYCTVSKRFPQYRVRTGPILSSTSSRGRRGYEVIQRAFWDENLFVRVSGDTIALSSPLIVSESDLADIIQRIRRVLHKLN
jgi:acetylornithine/succinyldiaminopimelate/putrescine aminotransferase